MSNNVTIKNASGDVVIIATSEEGGVHSAIHRSIALLTDSTGVVLPAEFDSLARNFTRDGQGYITAETRTSGGVTWTQTYTRDNNNRISNISRWVRS